MSDLARVSLSVRDDVARITLSGSVDSCAIDLQFAREFLHVVSSVEDSAARASMTTPCHCELPRPRPESLRDQSARTNL